ncbi:MAG: OmpA family protein [Deltaproteobacteria bacterium]|nr:OmpA family protein [Deltaproteobacteria bacterium]
MLAAALSLFFALSAPADAGELAFGYSANPGPSEKPTLIITPPRALSELTVVVEAGGESWEFTKGAVPAGQAVRFSWERDTSITQATAWVSAVFSDQSTEEVSLPLRFVYGEPLKVDLSRAVADVKARTLEVQVTAPVTTAEIIAYGAHKAVLSQKTVEISGGPGRIAVPWVGSPSEVVLLDVKLSNDTGWAGFTYSPWFLDIPHQDVLFPSNEAEILADEAPKLQRTLEELEAVLDKYGDVVPVKLYIAGCTDTVGDAGHNAELSRRRARAIAAWLRDHGYGGPILYHGFGEGLLAVPTGDGVDEAANRRALYLVGANPPPASAGLPPVSWTSL